MRVIVVGGGLVGSACAVNLQRSGAAVTLLDGAAASQDRASWGNATMIANELSEPLANWTTARKAFSRLFAFGGPLDFVLRDFGDWAPWALRYLLACRADRFGQGARALDGLCIEALPAWRRLLAAIGRTDLLDETPHWAVWETDESFSTGRAAVLASHGRAVEVRDLATQEMDAIRREVSPAAFGGVAFEGSARVRDPGAVVDALHAALKAGGGEIMEGQAQALEIAPDRAGIRTDGAPLSADLILIACGARSAPLARGAGLVAPLIAERGYHLQYAHHDLQPAIPALIFEDRFICVVRAANDVRITGFTEVGRADSPPDPRKWAALERHVAELGLPVRGRPTRWMGARPTLPDFLPAIGRKGSVLYAFGHQHIGLTLAAVTAEAIVTLAKGERPPALDAFALERFGGRAQ